MKILRFFFVGLLLLLLFFVLDLYKEISFFKKRERINILIYNQNPIFFSLEERGDNYYARLSPSFKIVVPGGYGEYSIGALGKLSLLEMDPEILRRSFSLLFGNPIDFYFYKDLSKIYYSRSNVKKEREEEFSVVDVLRYNSNANLFERLYLFVKFLRKADGVKITVRPEEREGERIVLKKFQRRIQALFYSQVLRQEDIRVKIFYKNEPTAAVNISSVLEGSGIDVLDFEKGNFSGKCKVVGSKKSFTLEFISRSFGCVKKFEKIEDNLIEFYLGNKEEKWR